MILCPKCNFKNNDDADACYHCGYKFSDETISIDSAGDSAQPDTNTKDQRVPDTPVKLPSNPFGLKGDELLAGRYKVLKMLGRGGMGAVFKVLDTMIGEIVALKLMNPVITSDEEYVHRFMREAKLAQPMMHEGIMRIYHIDRIRLAIDGKETETHYLVMEYLEGVNLTSWMKQQQEPVPVPLALDFCRQLCRILDYAHKFMIHRDIKPSNIMVGKNNKITLMDFGIAKTEDATLLTKSGWFIGSPQYAAPEQFEDAAAVTPASDIYSIGVILYELLTGLKPRGVTALPTDLRNDVPKKLDDIIRCSLQNDPQVRYQTADEMLEALDTVNESIDRSYDENSIQGQEAKKPKRTKYREGKKELLKLRNLFVMSAFSMLIMVAAVFFFLKDGDDWSLGRSSIAESQDFFDAQEYEKYKIFHLGKGVNLETALIPQGKITITSTDAPGANTGSNGPTELYVPRPFYLGKHEVTQAQYELVTGNNPSQRKDCPECPVENVDYEECLLFTKGLNSIIDNYAFRLPTETEWEYACRTDSATDSFDDPNLMFWWKENAEGKTQPVGQMKANAWGLSDMLGNVWEWCANLKTAGKQGGNSNAAVTAIRGGSSWSDLDGVNPSSRILINYSEKRPNLGFRILAEKTKPDRIDR